MKKLIMAILVFILMLTLLVAGSRKSDLPRILKKEGIAPYELSESEKYILQSFNMMGNSQIISFNAPKEAITLNFNVYCLREDGEWDSIGGGGISLGVDRRPNDHLTGTVTMQLREDYVIDFIINNAGTKASYKTETIPLDNEIMASSIGFLQEFQSIKINTEIPIALMVYDSGMSMRSYALQDYFEPSKFKDMDLVQVVVLEFSDR